jgi:hypothetical protein
MNAPQPINEQIRHLSPQTMAECERVKARLSALAKADAGAELICRRLWAQFEAHSDLEASREFGDPSDATILGQKL